jgi:NAD(P)-dependent dehydrogenase (short-subunit alcohol dehydrogenase family)
MNSVLISGASTGIGEACAVHLAQHGWRVFAGVRTRHAADRLRAAAPGIHPLMLDITAASQIAEAVMEVASEVGADGLQGLINNAGIAITGPLEFLPAEALRKQMDVNFFGQVELTRACLPLLRSGHGRVLNISSVGGRIVAPFLAPYSVSKFALEAFTDGLRRELHPWGIHVISIQPGAIATPIWKKSLQTGQSIRSTLPVEAETLYGAAMNRVVKRSLLSAARGISVQHVARLAHVALTSRRPRPRYVIGRGTWLAVTLSRLLPDELLDWLMRTASYG